MLPICTQDAAPSAEPSADDQALSRLSTRLGEHLLARGEWLATAESCTGGWVAQALTAIPGSSGWFERGLVSYSNAAKVELLGVPASSIAQHGAVSEQVALAMAEGVLARCPVQWSLAITGIAGPSGGSPEKPVGTVCFAWGQATDGPPLLRAISRHFDGDRAAIRRQSVAYALRVLADWLAESNRLA